MRMGHEALDFIPTRGSFNKSSPNSTFKAVSYQSYKAKKETQGLNLEPKKENEASTNFFNMKQAKHEIIKFGTSGFDPQKKEEAKIQLTIKLGAKPPKNKYKNYKLLLKERQQEHQKEKTRLSFQQLGKNNVGKSNAKGKTFDRKRRKGNGGILDIYGKVKDTSVVAKR